MLTAEQVQDYRDNGYLLVPGVFTPDFMAELRREIDAMVDRVSGTSHKMEATWGGKWRAQLLADRQPGQYAVTSIHNMLFHAAVFTRMLTRDRFVQMLTALVGPNVQLHHMKMHLKPPEIGSPFPLHQDYWYFPHTGLSMMAATVYVDDATVANGCLGVMPRSHKLGPLPHDHEGSHHLSPTDYPLENATPCPGKAGDVLCFSYLTIHGSWPNRTQTTRRIALVQVRDPTDHPTLHAHESPGQGIMLAGINPEV